MKTQRVSLILASLGLMVCAVAAQVAPQQGNKYPVGTSFKGTCRPPATPPSLMDEKGNPKGIDQKYHQDWQQSTFSRIEDDGRLTKVGEASFKFWTDDELANNAPTCKTIDNYQTEPLVINEAGHFVMEVQHHQEDWTYIDKEMNLSGWSVPGASRKDEFEKIDFMVFDCGESDSLSIGGGDSCDLNAGAVRAAFKREFGGHNLNMPACYLSAQKKSDQMLDFQVRLGANHSLLPTQAQAREQGEGGQTQEGAKEMLIGSVQVVGGQLRVLMRIIDVETGVVKTTGKADAACPGGLDQAVHDAMKNLNTSLQSYAPPRP